MVKRNTKVKYKRSELVRQLTPIVSYVGSNGSGKTFCAVRDCIRSAERNPGRLILSNSPIDHPAYVPLTEWQQLLDARDCEILLDEVSGVASARQFSSLPVQLETRLQQLRKRNVNVRWTSPNYARADVILREVTWLVVACKGSLGTRPEGSPWRSHRWFRWTAYDAKDFEQFSLDMIDRKQLKRASTQGYLRRDADRFAAMYDTLSEVAPMGHMTLTGTCLNCGGKRSQVKCKCPDHSHDSGAGAFPSPLAGSFSGAFPDLDRFGLDSSLSIPVLGVPIDEDRAGADSTTPALIAWFGDDDTSPAEF